MQQPTKGAVFALLRELAVDCAMPHRRAAAAEGATWRPAGVNNSAAPSHPPLPIRMELMGSVSGSYRRPMQKKASPRREGEGDNASAVTALTNCRTALGEDWTVSDFDFDFRNGIYVLKNASGGGAAQACNNAALGSGSKFKDKVLSRAHFAFGMNCMQRFAFTLTMRTFLLPSVIFGACLLMWRRTFAAKCTVRKEMRIVFVFAACATQDQLNQGQHKRAQVIKRVLII